jgi:hypothetical protein
VAASVPFGMAPRSYMYAISLVPAFLSSIDYSLILREELQVVREPSVCPLLDGVVRHQLEKFSDRVTSLLCLVRPSVIRSQVHIRQPERRDCVRLAAPRDRLRVASQVRIGMTHVEMFSAGSYGLKRRAFSMAEREGGPHPTLRALEGGGEQMEREEAPSRWRSGQRALGPAERARGLLPSRETAVGADRVTKMAAVGWTAETPPWGQPGGAL